MESKTEVKLGVIAILAVLLFTLAGVVGYVKNLMVLFNMSFDPLTGEAILRIIGVFLVPIGMILGWL